MRWFNAPETQIKTTNETATKKKKKNQKKTEINEKEY